MNNISVTFDGIQILANIISKSPKALSAKIESPEELKGIEVSTQNIPNFAMQYSNWYYRNGKITKKGIKAIEKIIVETYKQFKIKSE